MANAVADWGAQVLWMSWKPYANQDHSTRCTCTCFLINDDFITITSGFTTLVNLKKHEGQTAVVGQTSVKMVERLKCGEKRKPEQIMTQSTTSSVKQTGGPGMARTTSRTTVIFLVFLTLHVSVCKHCFCHCAPAAPDVKQLLLPALCLRK